MRLPSMSAVADAAFKVTLQSLCPSRTREGELSLPQTYKGGRYV